MCCAHGRTAQRKIVFGGLWLVLSHEAPYAVKAVKILKGIFTKMKDVIFWLICCQEFMKIKVSTISNNKSGI